jgi:hypothetical protein
MGTKRKNSTEISVFEEKVKYKIGKSIFSLRDLKRKIFDLYYKINPKPVNSILLVLATVTFI